MRNLNKAAPVRPALLLLVLAVARIQAIAQDPSVPQEINYQGTLTDAAGQPLSNGTYKIEFRVSSGRYASEPCDQLIWARRYSVAVAGGHFNVILGSSGTNISASPPVTLNIGLAFNAKQGYLGLTITENPSGAITAPVDITPRQQILSTPYSFSSGNGIPIGAIIPWVPPQAVASLAEARLLVPEGFELCAGRRDDSAETPGFDETQIPDLTDGRFLKGAGTNDGQLQVGLLGGTNTHAHVLSGTASASGSGYGKDAGAVPPHIPHHASIWESHTHAINIPTNQVTVAEHVPLYVTVLYLVRVK